MALRSSGQVAAISSQEDDAPTWFGDGPYIVVFDPLDGSRDFDDHTPTGTIFGIYHRILEADHLPLGQKAAINVMQRGERLVAAGYALYSSATMLCISVGSGLYGFSLDNEVGEFVLTHPDIRIPERGLHSNPWIRFCSFHPDSAQHLGNLTEHKLLSIYQFFLSWCNFFLILVLVKLFAHS